MFTVKHINLDDSERLYQAHDFYYFPKENKTGTVGRSAALINIFSGPDGAGKTSLTGGTIFVMNELGKTVARYDLGASNVPIAEDRLKDPRHAGLCAPIQVGGPYGDESRPS